MASMLPIRSALRLPRPASWRMVSSSAKKQSPAMTQTPLTTVPPMPPFPTTPTPTPTPVPKSPAVTESVAAQVLKDAVKGKGKGKHVITEAKTTGSSVEITFEDGATYSFHSLWLRDACRQEGVHLLPSVERDVPNSSIVQGLSHENLKAQRVAISEDGDTLVISWQSPAGTVPESTFTSNFLRVYADRVAAQLALGTSSPVGHPAAWLDPFDDTLPEKVAPKPRVYLSNRPGDLSGPATFKHDDLADSSVHEAFLRVLADGEGCAIVDGIPDDPEFDGSSLAAFAAAYTGHLQKHPLREDAHWTISTVDSVQIKNSSFTENKAQLESSNSYNTKLQLMNHTDQVLYGVPGMLLGFHCAMGEGNNSLVDGFAVARAMRERDPKAYEIISRYGMDNARRLGYYRNGVMCFNTSKPIIQVDGNGDPIRIQYHEMYRTPLTVPHNEFQDYYAALRLWYQMIHSDEFQMHFKIGAGQLIIMNNWRMLHGRAGLEGKARIILGGTVTRDAFYSRARLLLQEKHGLDVSQEVGLPTALFNLYA